MNIYKTHNVCSRSIEFEVENNIITACKFNGGCAGNTQGVAALVVGMTVDEAIRRLKGIRCRNGTSCPDQARHRAGGIQGEPCRLSRAALPTSIQKNGLFDAARFFV